MSDHAEQDADCAESGAAWIRRLVNAWDCCATCAGGVLAERDRRVVADAEQRALREAARDWDADSPEHVARLNRMADEHYHPGGPSMPAIWLRDRADQIGTTP